MLVLPIENRYAIPCLVINTNLHPISHHFKIVAVYYAYLLGLRQEVPLFNTPVRGEPLNSRSRNLASRN